jgi:hypothetical protein
MLFVFFELFKETCEAVHGFLSDFGDEVTGACDNVIYQATFSNDKTVLIRVIDHVAGHPQSSYFVLSVAINDHALEFLGKIETRSLDSS